MGNESVAGVVLVLVFAALAIGTLLYAGRRPDRMDRLYSAKLWERIAAWIVVLALAALLGSALAGSTTGFLSAIFVLAVIGLRIAWAFWVNATFRSWMRDLFR